MSDDDLTRHLKELAADLGFARAGVAPAVTPPGAERLDAWLAAGYAGEMGYLAERRAAYQHPHHVLNGARSVLVVALDYLTAPPQPARSGQGRVSRYAWGDLDYHRLVRPKLYQLADALRDARPGATTRCVIDSAPLMEREFALLAGLGWIGKNTLLLSRERGSYFFLAAVVTDASLAIDTPSATDHCGSCTACLDACPTGAFVEPRVLDASKCISYLTIELQGLPPKELRPKIGEWLFGCDVCQEVCPWNRFATPTDEPELWPSAGNNPMELAPLFELDDAAFRRRFHPTPLWRPRRRGLLRNAAIVLGATRAEGSEPALRRGLADDEPLVRAACAWALGQIATPAALGALRDRAAIEAERMVTDEIRAAIAF